jgi:hypothetical protein
MLIFPAVCQTEICSIKLIDMKTVAETPKYFYPSPTTATSVNPLTRFLRFAEQQEKNHFGWVGGSIMLQASVLFPLTLLLVLANGASFGLMSVAIAGLAMVVVTNLAALPTKITIPVLVLSALIDVAVVVAAFV